MECEIVIDQAYPVVSLFPINDHWADPEYNEFVDWIEVPDELIAEYNAIELLYKNMQRKLMTLRDTHIGAI